MNYSTFVSSSTSVAYKATYAGGIRIINAPTINVVTGIESRTFSPNIN